MNGSKAPAYPDPTQTAATQADLNRKSAATQYELNATNQTTPYGSLTYNQVGTWSDGTPKFEATQAFSPEQQKLYDLQTQGQTQYGQIANQQLGRVADTLGSPFDFNAATDNKINDIQRGFLDPQWDRQLASQEANLRNRGILPGSEAYTNAMRDFSTNRQRAYDQSYLDSYNTAENAALTERNQPLREIAALLSGSQPQQPTFVNTPQAGVAPVDYTGQVSNQYNAQAAAAAQQNQQQNAMLGGLFGTAATLAPLAFPPAAAIPTLGGWGATVARAA